MKKDNRLEILRIISMVLVIVVHVSNRYSLLYPNIDKLSYGFSVIYNALSRVCVPLFFMISGAVMIGKKYEKKEYFSRIKKLIIILAFWTVIYYVWALVYKYPANISYINLIKSLFDPIRSHLWFMYAIIGLYICQPFISNMVLNMKKDQEKLFIKLWMFFAGIVFILRVALSLIKINTSITYPNSLFNATYYLGYFVTGYILYSNINKIKIRNIKSIILMSLSFIINIIVTYFVSINSGKHYEMMFAYCSIFNMIPSILLFIMVLKNVKNKNIEIINILSKVSLGIYFVHIIFVDILIRIISINSISPIYGIPLFTIIVFVFSFIPIYLFKKIPVLKNLC